MNLKPAKFLFGAIIATSLGALATSVHASAIPSAPPAASESHYVILAGGMGDKAQGKVNEMNEGASGAANAVEERHEQHEAAEASDPDHSVEHKAKGKWHEMKGEARGAGDAVEGAHERHEMQENER